MANSLPEDNTKTTEPLLEIEIECMTIYLYITKH